MGMTEAVGRLQAGLRVLTLALQGEDATVTVVHSKTKDAREICAEADILIAAIGKAEMVKADWVKPGAAVIDVGTNPIPVRSLHFFVPLVFQAYSTVLLSESLDLSVTASVAL